MPKDNLDIRAPKGTTLKLASYLVTVQDRELPENVALKTKCHLLDTLAAIISGSRLKAGKLAIEFAASQGGTAEATVWGSDMRTTAINAALANGMSGHADETDDSHLGGRFHPGCAVVPAALAVGERQGKSGKAVLKSIAVGYDIGARFSMALGASGPRTITHSTHSLGALFGATGASTALMNFTPEQACSVLSYAIQQASGIPYWERDREHVEKAFDFGGMGARNGVAAAMMVDAGMTGVQDPLEGKLNYLSAFSENANADALTSELGDRFEIMEASIKKWCVGSPIQAALDACMALLQQGLDVAKVEEIRLIMPDDRLPIVDNRDMPDVCLQHMVAVCLLERGANFAVCHDRDRMTDRDVMALRAKITVTPSPQLTNATPARQAIVEVKTNSGQKFCHHTKAVKGTPSNPMSHEDVQEKAQDLLVPVIGQGATQSLIDVVWNFESLEDVKQLPSITKGD